MSMDIQDSVQKMFVAGIERADYFDPASRVILASTVEHILHKALEKVREEERQKCYREERDLYTILP